MVRKIGLSKKMKKASTNSPSQGSSLSLSSPSSRCSTPLPPFTASEESEATVVDSPVSICRNPIVMELNNQEAEIISTDHTTDAPDTDNNINTDLNSEQRNSSDEPIYSDSDFDPESESLQCNSDGRKKRKSQHIVLKKER